MWGWECSECRGVRGFRAPPRPPHSRGRRGDSCPGWGLVGSRTSGPPLPAGVWQWAQRSTAHLNYSPNLVFCTRRTGAGSEFCKKRFFQSFC